jgi:hypothetical protein
LNFSREVFNSRRSSCRDNRLNLRASKSSELLVVDNVSDRVMHGLEAHVLELFLALLDQVKQLFLDELSLLAD